MLIHFKHGIVTPLLKKPQLNKEVLSNYRPVTQLSFVSKVLERLVCIQIDEHLAKHHLLSSSQSAYRSGHSTETALLALQNDVLQSAGRGRGTIVVLYDLTAAFDTINQDTLLDLLEVDFGFRDLVLAWFASYFDDDRTESVEIDGATSEPIEVEDGVIQGSVVGSKLFIM